MNVWRIKWNGNKAFQKVSKLLPGCLGAGALESSMAGQDPSGSICVCLRVRGTAGTGAGKGHWTERSHHWHSRQTLEATGKRKAPPDL